MYLQPHTRASSTPKGVGEALFFEQEATLKNKLEKMKETYVMLWELTVEFVIPVLSVMFVVAVVLPPIIRVLAWWWMWITSR